MTVNRPILPTYSELYRHQPLLFIPNYGQADASVSYIAQKIGYYVGVSPQAVSMTLCRPNESCIALHLVWKFLDAAADASVEGLEQGYDSFHYFTGPRADYQFLNLPSYRQVICRGLWAGIDVLIHEHNQSLAYEWIIHSGAQPQQIRFVCEGCTDIRLDEAGNLIIDTSLGLLTNASPLAYQHRDSESFPVACQYVLNTDPHGRKTIGYTLPDGYDKKLILLIK